MYKVLQSPSPFLLVAAAVGGSMDLNGSSLGSYSCP
jgi:hypothetical protein